MTSYISGCEQSTKTRMFALLFRLYPHESDVSLLLGYCENRNEYTVVGQYCYET